MATTLVLNPPLFGFARGDAGHVGRRYRPACGRTHPRRQRRTAGMALAAIGAATTIPVLMSVLGRRTDSTPAK